MKSEVRSRKSELRSQAILRAAVPALLVVASVCGATAHEPYTDSAVNPVRYHRSTGERLAAVFRERGFAPEFVVMAVAALPIVELRGAVPVGINVLMMPWYRAVLLSIVGNLAPIFFILLFLERVVVWLSHVRVFARFFEWLYGRTRRKSGLVARYRFWGLVFFVAVPLPVTGAWTGSVAAVLLGIGYWRALLAIAIGVCIAGAVVTSLSLLGVWGAIIAGVALAALAARALIGRKGNSQAV